MYRFFSVLFAFIIISCGSDEQLKGDENFSYLPDAVGGYSTVNVIADEDLWNDRLEDLIAPIFNQQIKGLITAEREFDYKTIRSKQFNRLFQRQRLIVVFITSGQVKQPGVSLKKDVYANGQIIVQVAAKNNDAVKAVFESKKDQIFQLLSEHRVDCIQRLAQKENNQELEDLLANNQGIDLVVPKSYTLGIDTPGFSYFFKKGEMKCEKFNHNRCYYQTGIFTYFFPYTSTDVFTAEKFTQMRDSITKLYIEGPSVNDSLKAFMEVYKGLPLTTKNITQNSKFGYQVNGWWDMKNGTMGGPFVSVSYVDEIRNRVIVADAFVFGPNFSKRRFVKELEAVCLSLKSAEE